MKASSIPKVLTPEIARELLNYNPKTGVLTWKKRSEKWFSDKRICNIWNSRYAGNPVGCITENRAGYRCMQTKLFGKGYRVHRLAWMVHTGEEPPEQIDHDDRDGTNNRWLNLKASNAASNAKNKSISALNTTGHSGVLWSKQKKKWTANIKVNGKRHYLGEFTNKTDAVKARIKAEKKHGFSLGHGKPAVWKNNAAK